MRKIVIEKTLYNFNELSKDVQQKVIDSFRNKYYQNNNFAEWAIDDCSLLEPKHTELTELLGNDYNFPLFKNNRNISFDIDSNYIDVSNGLEITNENHFFMWLDIDTNDFIDENGNSLIDYTISMDSLDFNFDNNLTEKQIDILDNAKNKFENHCIDILERIENDIDYRFSDEGIIEDIEANGYEFEEDGKIY
jgi:hypothetical protein